MIGILGSGFGLYGYLPAVAMYTNKKICLLDRYREKFHARKELLSFARKINWINNLNDFFPSIDTLVLSLNPDEQEKILRSCLKYDNIKRLVLEKPLSVSPSSSISLLSDIKNAKKEFRIGYTFPYTSWAEDLFYDREFMQSANKIYISWNFFAHHYKNNLQNWKRFHDQGGSVLRFYGIHLIALASDLGYKDVLYSNLRGSSNNDFNYWECCFNGKALPELHIIINSKSPDTQFIIDSFSIDDLKKNRRKIHLNNPFSLSEKDNSTIDSRVFLLEKILKSFKGRKADYYSNYWNTNLLWKKSEDRLNLFV